MNWFKIFVFLIFLAFLTGCNSIPCPPPGQPNLTGVNCQYSLIPLEPPSATGRVKAKLDPEVLQKNKEKLKWDVDYSNYPLDTVYTFIVDDPSLIQPNKKMTFIQMPLTDERVYDNTLKVKKSSAKIK